MKIAIDIDEVCDNLMETVLQVYNTKNNTLYTINDCHYFDLNKNFSADVANEMLHLFGDKEVQSKLQTTKDSIWGVETLINLGHDVCFATATITENIEWKEKWLLSNFTMVNPEQIIRIYNKGWLNADILIDDNIDNLKAGMYERICWDAPWNRNVRDDIYDIYRCKSWREIINAIKNIERKEQREYE